MLTADEYKDKFKMFTILQCYIGSRAAQIAFIALRQIWSISLIVRSLSAADPEIGFKLFRARTALRTWVAISSLILEIVSGSSSFFFLSSAMAMEISLSSFTSSSLRAFSCDIL